MVARWAHNPKVAGSNPVPAIYRKHVGGCVHHVRTGVLQKSAFVVLGNKSNRFGFLS